MSEPKTVQLLVTFDGANASVIVRRLAEGQEPIPAATIVSGRSFDDVIKALEAAALESQGRASQSDARQPGVDVHRCSGCGHRWEGALKGAELCGDCWRKSQPVLHRNAADAAQPYDPKTNTYGVKTIEEREPVRDVSGRECRASDDNENW